MIVRSGRPPATTTSVTLGAAPTQICVAAAIRCPRTYPGGDPTMGSVTFSTVQQLSTVDSPPDSPRPGPLGRLAGLAYRRRATVLIAWAVALAVAFGVSAAFGGELATNASVPGWDSAQAQRLLSERFPNQSGDTIRVVVRAGDVRSAAARHDVEALLGALRQVPHVASVEDPYASA